MNDLVPPLTPIDVFDGVMSPAACASLVKYLDATYQLDSTSTAYFNRAAPANTVERALHSVLQEIGDESPVVEYWRRGRWAHESSMAHYDRHANLQALHHRLGSALLVKARTVRENLGKRVLRALV